MEEMTSTLPLALALAAALSAEPDAGPAAGPRTELSTISGTIAQVAYAERRFTVATEQGTSTLEFDRNTAVYLPRRMGTLRDLAPGQPVRAGFGAGGRAYWIEIRSGDDAVPTAAAEAEPSSGPAVLAPPTSGPAQQKATAQPDAGTPSPGRGGAVSAGPGEPEPNPGARPSPPTPPAPAGPGPVPPATPN